MLWLPHDGDTKIITNLPTVGSNTPGTAVTTGGATTTKGTVAECISAANNVRDSWGIYIQATGYAAAGVLRAGAMDILIGGATDDILIPNLLMGQCSDSSGNGVKSWYFPIHIPAGVRVAAQAAGSTISTAMRVGIRLFGGTNPPHRVGRKVVTYGMGTVPNGTVITPGASGAQGAYTQLTASTSEDHFAFLPSFQINSDINVLGRNLHVGIGLGAATEDLIGEWDFDSSANETMNGPYDWYPRFRDVPAASRLTMRASCSGTLDDYDGVIHAVS